MYTLYTNTCTYIYMHIYIYNITMLKCCSNMFQQSNLIVTSGGSFPPL